ncbi:MAG: hypothetical protein AVDCRST_MAG68-951 [uncultured Gemmatimonadetes bacterium]|uniref:Uncharacterized protein n=1 Tax=uncultured Gemmatimonadota bacterium TaxID=203437 RepID=A0A6J4KIV0_9BACT|nr:MAG: hypothetical protein AVDCRST_MAG68-951 [uncultured Gemmatimonadota bacterium]
MGDRSRGAIARRAPNGGVTQRHRGTEKDRSLCLCVSV